MTQNSESSQSWIKKNKKRLEFRVLSASKSSKYYIYKFIFDVK